MGPIIKHLLLFLFNAGFVGSCFFSPAGSSGVESHPLPETADTNVVIPPAWAFGVLYGGYTDQEGTLQTIKKIQQHDYPIDAYWIDSWFWSFDDEGIGPHKYLDFVADTVSFPDRKGMWDFMQENNIKGGFWTWDCIQKTGNEEAFADFRERGYFRDVYMNTNPWHNKSTSTAMHMEGEDDDGTPTGNIDFDNPEAAAYFKSRMKHFFDEGADFIKLDRTTRLSVLKTMFEMSQEFGQETKGRGFMLSHMNSIDNEEYKRYPAKWTSDTRSDWTIEEPFIKFNSWVPAVAFKENIALYTDTTKKTSRIPFLTNDTGGFDMGLTDEPEEELFIRWVQFSMFNPLTSVFSQPENPTGNLAWNYSQRADSIFRFYSHLKMQLFPYIYSYAHRSRLEGKNVIRPARLYEYLLGEELFVAPVYEQGARKRELYLPEGEDWINFWDGKTFNGGQLVTCEAPLNQIPVFVKQGAILPMRKYASSIEKGSNDVLELHVYNGGNGEFTLIEDDGLSNHYLKGVYAKTQIDFQFDRQESKLIINPVEGYFEGMNDFRTWHIHIHGAGNINLVHFEGDPVNYQKTEHGIVFKLPEVRRQEKAEIVLIP